MPHRRANRLGFGGTWLRRNRERNHNFKLVAFEQIGLRSGASRRDVFDRGDVNDDFHSFSFRASQPNASA